MNLNSAWRVALGTAVFVAGAAAARAGVPNMDGQLDGLYGSAVAGQGSNVIDILGAEVVDGCFAVDNSNIGGKGAYEIVGTETELPFDSAPNTVLTGIEICVPLAELGYEAGFGTSITMCGFVNGSGHDFLSNQVIGGFGAGQDPDHLGEPRGLDFNASSGNQFVTIDVSPGAQVPAAATIDGTVDAHYGVNPVWEQNIGTSFGNSTDPAQFVANGSEIDAVWAYVDTNSNLYVLVAGNLETNFNKLDLFFDVQNGGQNAILGAANPDTDFNALRRMGDNTDGSLDAITGGPTGVDATGLTFDAGVAPDYWIGYTNGNPPTTEHYLNAAVLDTSSGTGLFVGGGQIATTPIIDALGPRSQGNIQASGDNSNILGVKGRVASAGSGSLADVTSPSTVATGVEFKVNLEGIGYDTSVFPSGTPENLLIGGFILGQNWDYLSNQIIGGITTFNGLPGSPPNDPGNLGGPAKAQDWNNWDGNQYGTLAVSAALNDPGITVDGTLAAGETLLGGNVDGYIPLWTNTTNGTGFGDSTLGDQFEADGSEIDAVYARVGLDGAVPTLYMFYAGNLHDFNRLVTFVDVDPSLNATTPNGQNDMRGDNADIDGNGLNRGLGGPDGMVWDSDFWPDYVISYATGGIDEDNDQTTDFTKHFAHGAQLLTDGGGFGGPIGVEEENNVGDPLLAGAFEPRIGAGDNDDNTAELANGSELDAIYIHVDTGDQLAYFFVTGNFEANFTSLELFFDTLTAPGVGQNTLIADNPLTVEADGNPDVDFFALQRMGREVTVDETDPENPIVVELQPGLTFETGFEADYYLSVRLGDQDVQANTANIYGNWARLGDGSLDPGEGRYLGSGIAGDPFGFGILAGGDIETSGLGFEPTLISVDNSNTAGVIGGAEPYFDTGTPPDPLAVITGFEICMELADLGWDGESEIRLVAFLNGPGHANVFNQVLPHICGTDPGEPRQLNFSDDGTHPGLQYVGYPTPVTAPPICEAPTPFCAGDANMDGFVDVNDISFVLFRLGDTGACADGDANGDGVVDVNDISYVLFRLGNTAPGCDPSPC